MRILAFETSCDETSVAVYDSDTNKIYQLIHSQIQAHLEHGGVVPEIASREHLVYLPRLLEQLLEELSIDYDTIDAIAYTRGPGLVGALLVGASFAQMLAYRLHKPLWPMHHIEAHMLITLYDHPELQWPFLALIVSGGHTLLVEAKALGQYEILGETLDDAAGEAFDKGGKCLGLPYPAGPLVAKLADAGEKKQELLLPRPLLNRPGVDFSFSGLKTAFVTLTRQYGDSHKLEDLCYTLQASIVDHLLDRLKRILAVKAQPVVVAGGVAMNRLLREKAQALCHRYQQACYFPKPQHCCDNAAMVAYTASLYASQNMSTPAISSDVRARWPLTERLP